MSRSVAGVAERFHRANLQAALVIIADPEHYGGEDALSVRWARAFVAAQNEWRLVA